MVSSAAQATHTHARAWGRAVLGQGSWPVEPRGYEGCGRHVCMRHAHPIKVRVRVRVRAKVRVGVGVRVRVGVRVGVGVRAGVRVS